eukprot:g73424.t1
MSTSRTRAAQAVQESIRRARASEETWRLANKGRHRWFLVKLFAVAGGLGAVWAATGYYLHHSCMEKANERERKFVMGAHWDHDKHPLQAFNPAHPQNTKWAQELEREKTQREQQYRHTCICVFTTKSLKNTSLTTFNQQHFPTWSLVFQDLRYEYSEHLV